MNIKFTILIILTYYIGFSQQKKVDIVWSNTATTIGTAAKPFKVPGFNQKHFNYSIEDGLQYIKQWKIAHFINEASVTLSHVKYAAISKSELYDLDTNKIPSELEFSLKNSTARSINYAMLVVSPIVKTASNTYKKVISFEINYQTIASKNSNYKSQSTISNSTLQDGDWYRFSIDTSGVYKITKSFLHNLGVPINSIHPRTIKIFGNGGRMIPYNNSEEYPIDLTENSIQIIGEEDGVFNDDDYILFYGEGPKGDVDNPLINTNINPYTDTAYYYIKISSSYGKRMQLFEEPSGAITEEINTFKAYQFHEIDTYNIGNLGRRWFGDKFEIENTKNFNFTIPNLITSEPVFLKTYVAAVSSSESSMDVSVNNNLITTFNFIAADGGTPGGTAFYENSLPINTDQVEIKLTYNNAGNPAAEAYVDYISIKATRALSYVGETLHFSNPINNDGGIGNFNIANAAEINEIWDITDLYNIKKIPTTNAATFSFKAPITSEKKYVTLAENTYLTPNIDATKTISNQNLKGTIFLNSQGNFQDIDYLVITPSHLKSEADRLIQINKQQYNLNVKVVTLQEIYNEFSSGQQDIGAIRNFIRYVYHNASNTSNRLQYVCLFGDTSFDYKDRLPNNNNIVPSWHAYQSFNYTTSYVSDDFFGMMDENEGEMLVTDKLDFAIGRIIANNLTQAKELVDKIESYYQKETYNKWRNNIMTISDDIDQEYEANIQITADSICENITNHKPFLNAKKVYLDAYKQESSSVGESYPKANTDILNNFEKGALVVNYLGHGGEEYITSEKVFTKLEAQEIKGECNLTCMITITCEYTRFDDPERKSAGEFVFWNKSGGAIALITTTRSIYVSAAYDFNHKLAEYIFSYNDTDSYQDHEYPTMAEALRLTKTDPEISIINQRRLVTFLGDPAMKLAIPKPNIRLTKINDIPITQATDTLKALSKIKFTGEVTNINGNLLNNYNGTISTTIFDKNIERTTLANDGVAIGGQLIKMDFTTLGEAIFRGKATVTNGLFEFNFIVPKDISIPVGYGKVSFYSNSENPLEDYTGANLNTVKIGGINDAAPEDNLGPKITLFMNDETFVSGGITNHSPTLLVHLEDENGINTASGVGHDILVILDGNETNPYILNDYYETELDDYTKGKANFRFRDLESGLHTLTLRAWDVYNNSSTQEIQFHVYNENEKLVLNNVLNYPNPFVSYTEFWFNHNSSEPLEVSIQIFTIAGKLVRTINGTTTTSTKNTSSLSRNITWDGRDDFGQKIGKGVYIYKITAHSKTTNKTAKKIEKLVIL